MDTRAQELICKATDGVATPQELKELSAMAENNPTIDEEIGSQRAAASALRSVGQPELADDISARFWGGVYNRIEYRAGWTFVILGFVAVTGYTLYLVCTDPKLGILFRFGYACMFVGIALLVSAVARHRRAQAAHDKYKEVIR